MQLPATEFELVLTEVTAETLPVRIEDGDDVDVETTSATIASRAP